MPAISIIPVNEAAGSTAGSDITISDGASVSISLNVAGPVAPRGARAEVFRVTSTGNLLLIGAVTAEEPVTNVPGPLTIRVTKQATPGVSFGVDRE